MRLTGWPPLPGCRCPQMRSWTYSQLCSPPRPSPPQPPASLARMPPLSTAPPAAQPAAPAATLSTRAAPPASRARRGAWRPPLAAPPAAHASVAPTAAPTARRAWPARKASAACIRLCRPMDSCSPGRKHLRGMRISRCLGVLACLCFPVLPRPVAPCRRPAACPQALSACCRAPGMCSSA